VPERLVEDALARNLGVVEEGLRLVRRQVPVPNAGRIDILALDRNGVPVVIEVKSGVVDDTALTQLLAYTAEVKRVLGRAPRRIIAAEDFTKRLRQAAEALRNVKLVKIAVKVVVEKTEEA